MTIEGYNEVGERALIIAVLERAILDAIGSYKINPQDSEEVQADACAWLGIFGKRPKCPTAGYSYEWICDVTGLDHADLRGQIEDKMLLGVRLKAHEIRSLIRTSIQLPTCDIVSNYCGDNYNKQVAIPDLDSLSILGV